MLMLVIEPDKKIYVYTQPIDMRKSINGLVIILLEEFDQNPQTGDCYLFVNRGRNRIKCLKWDGNGFIILYKRLEKRRFNYSKHINGDKIVVSIKQLQALLMGLDFYLLGEYGEKKYEAFF